MSLVKFTAVAFVLMLSHHVSAIAEDLDDVVKSNDICDERPELCSEEYADDDEDDGSDAPTVKHVAKTKSPAQIQQQLAKQTAAVKTRKTAPTVAEQPKRRCRVRGQTYTLSESDLPYCSMSPAQQKAAAIAARDKSLAAKRAAAIREEERFQALYSRKPASAPRAAAPAAGERSPAAISSGPAVTFESYMKSNSNHPALSAKINNRQSAFVEVARPAVIGIELKDDAELPPPPTVLGTPVPSMEKGGAVTPPPKEY